MPLNDQLAALNLEDQEKPHNECLDLSKRDVGALTPPPSPPPLGRIYRHTPVPTLILDASMSIVEVSDSHCVLFGKPRDYLLHATVGNLEPETIPVPNIPTLYGALCAACSTREAQVIEHILAKGSITYNLWVTPIFEEETLLYVVLEAVKLTHETIHNQHKYMNETYKILVDTVKDYAIFMLDPHGHIATWNSGASLLKGYKTEEIVGKNFSTFYGPEDRASGKPAKALAVCLREGRFEDEGWRYRRDGSRFWANVLITPIYQFGQHVGFVKVTRDLTERKEAESRMITAFEESSRLKTDFLANISHEIRTPMNGMQIAMTMLADTGLSDEQREHATIVQDSMSLLLQIVNDVLDYSKLSSGSFSLHADMLDVREVAGAVVRNCRSSLHTGVELTSTIPPDFPKRLHGDPLRYRQILQNLVGNAVKFTEQGSVHVSISCSPDEEDSSCSIIRTEVTDTGIGVPDSAINTLFTPFTRFANSTTRKYPGTGLGLSICKSLTELMNGTVGYLPNPETNGSIFWFTAKMGGRSITSPAKPSSKPATPVQQEVATKMRTIAPWKHILLVEDNIVNHTVMLKLLNTLGFDRVDGAWNGAEAVRMIKQKPLSYDIVLMDVSMPVMDGLEATARVREMGLLVPIIAITGNALKGDAETYVAKGMNDCIGKPVHRNQLLNVLWKWIGS
ncbi:sensor histidine kinase/response regulator Fos-1/TcsA [Aspergillus undulatus]|uniref:sensor histidine kinase/response regulator Fos-1/TcsA n=1 Tax=Aspergillus undulatus TaxID=1810928 RepID=UPI003CCCBDD0